MNILTAEPNSIKLLNTRIDDYSVNEIINYLMEIIHRDKKAIIANVNIHAMNLAYEIPSFRQFLNDANIVFCDGFGVMLASRLLNLRLNHRLTPPDWITTLCQHCSENDISLYFLGARQGVAEHAAQCLKHQFPKLKIVGTHHGFFDKTYNSTENLNTISQINAQKPQILLVGFGMPTQELWLQENWSTLDANVALPVGALFDYVAGEVFRVPRWLTDRGFEWLGRMIVEPGRLWQRYLIGNPLFFYRVFKHHLINKQRTSL